MAQNKNKNSFLPRSIFNKARSCPTSNNGLGVLGSNQFKIVQMNFPLLHCITIATFLSEFFKSGSGKGFLHAQMAFFSTFSL